MKTVLYMLRGRGHAANLGVSIYHLRKLWDGAIRVITGDAAAQEVAEYLAQQVADIDIRPWDCPAGGKGQQHTNKTRMIDLCSDLDQVVFFDADTVAVQPFDELWVTSGVGLTEFAGWVVTGNKMSARLRRWEKHVPDMVARAKNSNWPAINTGVMSFAIGDESRDFSKQWQSIAGLEPSFMADELVANLLLNKHCVRVFGHEYNCSPVYRQCALERVKIWHGHGGKFVKKQVGWALWRPMLQQALEARMVKREWLSGSTIEIRLLESESK